MIHHPVEAPPSFWQERRNLPALAPFQIQERLQESHWKFCEGNDKTRLDTELQMVAEPGLALRSAERKRGEKLVMTSMANASISVASKDIAGRLLHNFHSRYPR